MNNEKMLSAEQLADLRVKARAAPAGPWSPGDVEEDIVWAPCPPGRPDVAGMGRWVVARANRHVPETEAISAFISAANPAVVLALLDRIDRLEKALDAAPVRTFDSRCADALADEVDLLVRRRVIDIRSPAADALLDYRNPPSTQRSDRLLTLEAELARLTPSGQVAEDEAVLGGALGDTPDPSVLAALHHLAAKAQGYEAATVSNAVLLKALGPFAMMYCDTERAQSGPPTTSKDWPAPRCGACAVCLARRCIREPHPGAALLEVVILLLQHQRSDEPDLLTTLKRLLEERGPVAHMVSAEAHRKALAEARNEGLEEAARHLEVYFDQPTMAGEIRAKKERE